MDPVSPVPQASTPSVVPQPQPVAQPPQSKNKVWPWIVGGVLLLGVGIVGGVFLGKQLYSIPQPQLVPTPSPSEASAKEGDPTANWKTYTNEQAGYSLKYPGTWKFQASSEGCGPVFFPPDTIKTWLTICGLHTTQNNTPEEMANRSANSSSAKLESSEQILINGHNGIKQLVKTSDTQLAIEIYLGNVEGITKFADGRTRKDTGTLAVYYYTHDLNKLTEVKSSFDQILSTFKFLDSSPVASPTTTTYTVPSSWKRFTAQDGLKLCLPLKWEPDAYGHTLTFNRDSGYQPLITIIADIPYSSGPTREAYFKFWEREYPDVRQLVLVTEININGKSALLISPTNSSEPKTSPEGLVVVWYASGKLWKAGVSSWNMTNDSQSAFLKDFYTMISCSF